MFFFREDMKKLLGAAGDQAEATVFLFTDSQIKDEGFLGWERADKKTPFNFPISFRPVSHACHLQVVFKYRCYSNGRNVSC